ncbi:GNAT family N-acetyltransferase [Paenibacillus thailandensis]|uniref:GNAT family N-acetyltransferase n=1 Tax=Paenibacillus thailandensis TaxID=393250 RepID=A0ABW5QU78_9BACL
MEPVFSGQPIEGNAISLRYACKQDLDEYFAYLQDEETTRLTGSQQHFTREGTAVWLQKISAVNAEERVDYMIIEKSSGKLIGEVVLNEIDTVNRSANIRIGIRGSGNRGKGYGTEAMRLMLRVGFEDLKLHRIHLGVYAFNPRAVHVYEKIGFRREGVQRDVLFDNGQYHDMILMAMLEQDYEAVRGGAGRPE